MDRRGWLRWGCAHCMALSSLAMAQATPPGPTAPGAAAPASPPFDASGWATPPRFTRPDLASDEGGLWALMDREETRLRRSPFRIQDAALANYLGGVAARLAGAHAADMRVYALRTALFNASMAPNGMMQLWSGLLLRIENEAQLAAVIGHEVGHYLQRHSLERLRDVKQRAAFGTFTALFGLVGAIGQLAAVAGLFSFSREHERQADAIGIRLMQDAGYDPREAAKVWANLLQELQANPDADPSRQSLLFATHPPSHERRETLAALAAGGSGGTGAEAYRRHVAPHRFGWLGDELKRARPDETLALLNRLIALEPGSAELLYFRGELRRLRATGDDAALALADLDAALRAGGEPPLTHRALGYLYRSAARPADSRAAWQRYLELSPNAADAEHIRQALQELPT